MSACMAVGDFSSVRKEIVYRVIVLTYNQHTVSEARPGVDYRLDLGTADGTVDVSVDGTEDKRLRWSPRRFERLSVGAATLII